MLHLDGTPPGMWVDSAQGECAVDNYFDRSAPKKATNVSVNRDLLRQARGLGLNLSQTLEDRLVEIVREHRRESWLEENRDAIDDYNRRVQRDGAFSDGLRRF